MILFALRSNKIKPLRILVVDDDALSRDVLTLLLEHAGYTVETADSGDAAVERLSAQPGPPPSVVLADMQMPGTAGSALAQQLRPLCGVATLLFAMSASAPDAEATRGFDGFLLKPLAIEELIAAITAYGKTPSGTADPSSLRDAAFLDHVIYDKLAASMRKERLEQLYALCLADTEKRITRMLQTASNRNDAAYRKDAHAIKGGAGMLGAVELQTLAAVIEENGIDANHVASLEELRIACTRLRRILIARSADGGTGISEEDA